MRQVAIHGYTAYGASKWALRGLAEALQMEVKPFGIFVSVSYPPDTDTPGKGWFYSLLCCVLYTVFFCLFVCLSEIKLLHFFPAESLFQLILIIFLIQNHVWCILCVGYKEEMLSKPQITRALSEAGQVFIITSLPAASCFSCSVTHFLNNARF